MDAPRRRRVCAVGSMWSKGGAFDLRDVRFGSVADIERVATNVSFGSEADIDRVAANVSFGPKADN